MDKPSGCHTILPKAMHSILNNHVQCTSLTCCSSEVGVTGGDPTLFFEFELNRCALVMGTATFRLPRVWPVQYDENNISVQIAEPLCLLPLSAKTSAMRFELRQEHHRVARFIIAVYIISGGCRDPHPPSSLSCVPPRHQTMDLRSYFQWHHKRHPVLPLSQHTKSSCDSRKVHLVPAMRCVQMASWEKTGKSETSERTVPWAKTGERCGTSCVWCVMYASCGSNAALVSFCCVVCVAWGRVV